MFADSSCEQWSTAAVAGPPAGKRHGGWARGPGGFGGFIGGGGMPGGRRLGSPELQLVLLALLAEQPAHGYELIRILDERSGGFYTPSPGMVYPALTYLEEIGFAAVTPDGQRKLYSITASGLAHMDAHREDVATILAMLQRIGSRMAEVREAFAGVGDIDPQAADEVSRARYALKTALRLKRGCSPEQLRRVARILVDAAAEVEKI